MRAAGGLARATLLAAILGGCAGDKGGTANAEGWTTVADSTGDTIRVRISGAMPERAVRRLVLELRVGDADGAEEVTFGSVDDVIGTADGGLLILDGQTSAVRLFDAQGRFIRRVGAAGAGPGEHGHLNGIARIPGGDWVFWDAAGGRLNRYSSEGAFRSTVRLPISGWFLSDGLRSDTASNLYAWRVLSRAAGTGAYRSTGFLQLDTTGAVLDTIVIPSWGPEPATLSAQSSDGGSTMTMGLPFASGSEAALLRDGGLVSGPGAEYVFYLLPRAGKPLRVEREHAAVPVSSLEASEQRARITQRLRRVNPGWSWTGADVPATKPAYRSFLVGDDNRVWVELSTAGEPIPADELPPVPQTPDPPVQLTTREPALYDVYSAAGRLLGRVVPPPRTRLLRADRNHVWGVQLDSLDVSYAVRFRIEPALPF